MCLFFFLVVIEVLHFFRPHRLLFQLRYNATAEIYNYFTIILSIKRKKTIVTP